MTNDIKRNQITRLCFYTLWLVLALIQAYNTQLLEDEAYYWVFGNNLDWGYYENSPMIGAMIRLGYSILPNELGVRLLSVFMITGYLYMLELLVKPQNLFIYYITISSIAVIHLIGVLSVPDTPLLFFGMCFFHLYKRYLEKDSIVTSLLLALNIALLLFSKYHGILVIAFTVASNPALFKRKSFWFIVIMALILFSPHILWQINNDFPTIKFNLSERFIKGGYNPIYTLNYIASIPLLLAPITGTVLLILSFKRKPINQFEKSMKYVAIGVLVFFGVMTFRGNGEGNWILSALAPAVILGYRQAETKSWFYKFSKYSFYISIILIAAVRIYFAKDIFGVDKLLLRKTHGWKIWAHAVKEKAGDRPVVFMNSYQRASQYMFYTKAPLATSMNNRMAKRNQYDLWNYEDKMQGKEVMVVTNYHIDGLDSIITPIGKYEYQYVNNFRSGSHINVYNKQEKIIANPSELIPIEVSFGTDKGFNTDVEANKEFPAKVTFYFFDGPNMIHSVYSDFTLTNSMLHNDSTYTIDITMPQNAGTYYMYTDISMGWLPPSINSNKTLITIK